MNYERPFLRAIPRSRIIGVGAILCASIFCAALPGNAQDAAEAARQEKARKAAQPQKPSHVYTNEDLQRSQILTPEDRTAVEARKRNVSPPAVDETSPASAPAQDAATSESLGEIARHLRAEKAAHQAEQARKLPQPSPFHMDLPHDAALAHPKPLARPLVAPSFPAHIAKPPVPAGAVKRDPFSRAIVPAAPRSAISAPLLSVSPAAAPPPVAVPVVAPPTTTYSSLAGPSRRPNSVRIQVGDSLWNLSRQYLGKGSRWQEWLNHNPAIGDPRRLQPGSVLVIPQSQPAAASATESRTGRPTEASSLTVVTVQPGDSLWRIAAKLFGRGADWPCLAHANPNLQDVSRIYPGQTLKLPASCLQANPASPEN